MQLIFTNALYIDLIATPLIILLSGEQRAITIRYFKKQVPCNYLGKLHEPYVTKGTKKEMCPGCCQVFDYTSLR